MAKKVTGKDKSSACYLVAFNIEIYKLIISFWSLWLEVRVTKKESTGVNGSSFFYPLYGVLI